MHESNLEILSDMWIKFDLYSRGAAAASVGCLWRGGVEKEEEGYQYLTLLTCH